MGLKVVDLFCGAGGFSEGFRQMGFEVTYAVDIWKPAVETHRRNHPNTETLEADVLEMDPVDLGKVDVLIGSPPCTQFSFANKGGKGDTAEGMKLVLRYLEFVADLKPRYWIMENVPRLLETLPEEVNLSDAGLTGGTVRIPRREVLNSADYGAPQKRLRLVSGNYPLPTKSHSESQTSLDLFSAEARLGWVPMRRIIEGLPNPLKRPRMGTLSDPNYPNLNIPVSQLTEHFYDSRMTKEEAEANRRAKTDHSWYGRMRFPDNPDRPARTVMATQLKSSRETIAIEVLDGRRTGFRQPTVRECACLQTFPITYQFWGRSATSQYMLVGNAVPPALSRALARAILRAEGIAPPASPILERVVRELPPETNYRQRTSKRLRALPLDRKFRDHIPGSRIGGVRVDFDNMGRRPAVRPVLERCCGGVGCDERHIVQWVARLYIGGGKNVVSTEVGLDDALYEIAGVAENPKAARQVKSFIKQICNTWPDRLPDATTLQGVWSERTAAVKTSPKDVVALIGRAVDRYLSEDSLGEVRIGPSGRIPIIPKTGLPIRSTAQLLGAAFAADITNMSDRWILENWDIQYRPEEWGESGTRPNGPPSWADNERLMRILEDYMCTRTRLGNLRFE